MKKTTNSRNRAKVKAANRQENPLESISAADISQDQSYVFVCRRFRQLHRSILKWAFELLTSNMKELYERSNWGWDSRGKLLELTAANAWCLLVKKRTTDDDDSNSDSDSEEDISSDCLGFAHFRYDLDYGIAVLYCYEIQVIQKAHGRGIGRRLISILGLLAERTRMEKVMATVFKQNQGSVQFFKRLGFEEDDTNPGEDEGKDYVILSSDTL